MVLVKRNSILFRKAWSGAAAAAAATTSGSKNTGARNTVRHQHAWKTLDMGCVTRVELMPDPLRSAASSSEAEAEARTWWLVVRLKTSVSPREASGARAAESEGSLAPTADEDAPVLVFRDVLSRALVAEEGKPPEMTVMEWETHFQAVLAAHAIARGGGSNAGKTAATKVEEPHAAPRKRTSWFRSSLGMGGSSGSGSAAAAAAAGELPPQPLPGTGSKAKRLIDSKPSFVEDGDLDSRAFGDDDDENGEELTGALSRGFRLA